MTEKAKIDILVHCFYHRVGLHRGHPVMSVRWPLTPMPQETVNEVYGGKVFSLGSTNTVLIRDGDLKIVHDPGILQLGRYGTLAMRLEEFGLKPGDVDVVINSHCHYDHIEANYMFKGKPLYVHEEEVKFFFSNAPAETTVSQLLLVAFNRWRVERCFQDQKQDIGLDAWEGRRYIGLKRHLILSSISYLFLARTRARLRGKKLRLNHIPSP